MFLVEGWKMVNEAHKAGWELEAVVLREDLRADNEVLLAELPQERLFYLDVLAFNKISALHSPEGVLAVLHIPEVQALNGTLPAGKGFLLEQVQDPGNLGTLMRIADWFGLHGLVCSRGTVDVYNPNTLRASMGAVFRVPVFYEEKWEDFLERHQERIWMADMKGESLSAVRFDDNDWVLLGNEANGLNESTRSLLQHRSFTIPGRGEAESLNVAVAGGIIASQL